LDLRSEDQSAPRERQRKQDAEENERAVVHRVTSVNAGLVLLANRSEHGHIARA
jgi:hypothetical protein